MQESDHSLGDYSYSKTGREHFWFLCSALVKGSGYSYFGNTISSFPVVTKIVEKNDTFFSFVKGVVT